MQLSRLFCMPLALDLDREAIARACHARGVHRLSVFGSATSPRYRPETSDVDFLVEFAPSAADPFDAYFGLKEDLERITGTPVDLVMTSALLNPYFAASANAAAEELYAA